MKWTIVHFNRKIIDYLNAGNNARKRSATSMNPESSRSHVIVSFLLEKNSQIISKIQIVDLAGSEKPELTQNQKIINSQNESILINKSLLFLSTFIMNLGQSNNAFNSGRDCILTHHLKVDIYFIFGN